MINMSQMTKRVEGAFLIWQCLMTMETQLLSRDKTETWPEKPGNIQEHKNTQVPVDAVNKGL